MSILIKIISLLPLATLFYVFIFRTFLALKFSDLFFINKQKLSSRPSVVLILALHFLFVLGSIAIFYYLLGWFIIVPIAFSLGTAIVAERNEVTRLNIDLAYLPFWINISWRSRSYWLAKLDLTLIILGLFLVVLDVTRWFK